MTQDTIQQETKIQDTIPVGKPFRVKGRDHSLFKKGERNELIVFLRAEGFWVGYPENKQWRVWKAIEKNGIEFVSESLTKNRP